MDQRESLESYIQTHIDEAIDSKWIKAYYQPVVRTITERIAGYEVLARWDDPNYGFLTPDVFIEALEKNNTIYRLDLEILRQVCLGYQKRHEAGEETVPVSFNLSRADLDLADIHERINEIVNLHGVPHSMIHIEITESSSSQGADFLEEHILWFHQDGYEVWMDDFGSGYSTFNTIQIHSFDTLKLDMTFLRNFNDKGAEIIKSIVKLAKKLGMGTVCEGVESEDQVKFLKEVGCERMQGWYYGRPQPAIALKHLAIEETQSVETSREQSYWNRISREDLVSVDPLMLIEYEANTWNVLEANEAMLHEINQIHPGNADMAIYEAMDPTHSLFNTLNGVYSQVARTGETRRIDYIDNGSLILLTVSYVASMEKKCALKLTIRNIHADLEYQKHSMLNKGIIGLYSQFELVNLINPKKDTAMQIYSNACFQKVYGKTSLRQGIKEFTSAEVYVKDQERYAVFMDMDTLEERFRRNKVNFMTEAFRLRDKAGDFRWKMVTLLRELSGWEPKYLYEIQAAHPKALATLTRDYEK